MVIAPAILLVLTVTLIFGTLPSAASVTYQTPLKPGDSALYNVSGSYSENVTTTEMRVQTVTGFNLTFDLKDRYINGDERIDLYWIDIKTGQRNWIDLSTGQRQDSDLVIAVGADLNTNNPIFESSMTSIEGQTMSDCGGQLRNINNARDQISNPRGLRNIKSYWDRSSGILCRVNITDPSGDLQLNMISTSLWGQNLPQSGGLTPLQMSGILAPILLIIGFAIFTRKRRRKNRLKR